MTHTAYFFDETSQPVEQYLDLPYEGTIATLIANEGFEHGVDAADNNFISKAGVSLQDIYSNGSPLQKAEFIPPSIPVKP